MDSKKIAIILVIVCSILGTLAQFSFKLASTHVVMHNWKNIIQNPYLLIGYLMYGISMVLLTIALKKGDLSFLYPFLALTFVWVVLFSPMLFKTDRFIFARMIGVAMIVLGISFIGIGGKK